MDLLRHVWGQEAHPAMLAYIAYKQSKTRPTRNPFRRKICRHY